MRLIDADKLQPDRMTDKGLAISQSQIANAPTVCDIEQIRAEIEQARFIDKNTKICKNALASGLEAALQIIDRYMKGE